MANLLAKGSFRVLPYANNVVCQGQDLSLTLKESNPVLLDLNSTLLDPTPTLRETNPTFFRPGSGYQI